MLFDLPKEQSSIIKVVGVGGGGSNAVNYMFSQGIRGVNFVICNTDSQAMELSPVPNKIQLGPFLTEGLGAGSDPEIGKRSAEESIEDIKKILEKNTRMVFVTAGMGGGTGTGGAPVIARIAKELGILTVGIVTTPFNFEGRRKIKHAEEGIESLRQNVDSLIVISNDKIREIYGNLTRSDAFGRADDILTTAAKSISEIITVPGQINVDFADVQHVMKNSGVAIMGSFVTEGENRAIRAVEGALNSPLLNDNNISGAKKVLINITTGTLQATIDEIDEINNYVQDAAGNDADVIFGTCDDESLGEKISVTVIATGYERSSQTYVINNNKKPEAVKQPEPVVENGSQKIFVDLDTEVNVEPQVNDTTVVESTESVQSVSTVETVTEEIVVENNLSDTSEEDNVSDTSFVSEPEANTDNVVEFEIQNSFSVEEAISFEKESETQQDLFSDFKIVVKDETEQPQNNAPLLNQLNNTTPDRIKHLSTLSMKLNNQSNLNEIEQVPAYKRKAITLNSDPHSSQSTISKYTHTNDADNETGEIRRNNSFLHDNVD
jgi:cell division protein FtsZ